ncbi:MAG: integrin alpha [Candidatus Binatia bacterium]
MRGDRWVFGVIFFLLCGLPANGAARTMILDNPERLPFCGFGSSLALAGDIDGDQIPDYIVGAYNHRWDNNNHQGRAYVFSGKSGSLLYTLDTPFPQEKAAFGFAVTSAGDVTGDGIPDVLIGAFGQEKGGKAFLFNGNDGKYLYQLQAPQPELGAGFGWAVASIGDLTADGIPDLGVGAFAQGGEGKVFLFNGRDGTLLHTIDAPEGSFAFGWAVSRAGDLNTDGTPDILVGAPYTTIGKNHIQGQVYVFSGKDQSLLYTLDNPQPVAGSVFGWRVASASDLNKDEVPDILVGAPYQDVADVPAQGAAFAFDGATGKLLFALKNPVPRSYAAFGYALTTSPDVNGDGAPEILIGAPYQTVDQFHVQGEVFLFNGQDGRHLATFDNPYGHQGSSFGYAIAAPGDINDDEIPDFAVGSPGQLIMDKPSVGRVFVIISEP